MDYITFKMWWKHKDAVFNGHNGADGTSNDTSTDPVITRDPNNYLLPRVASISVMHTALIILAVLGIIILLPVAIKTVKSNV